MSGQKIIQGLKEALDHAYSEQPDWCPQEVWSAATGWVEAHASMQATGAASTSLPVSIIAKAILAAKAEEREACIATANGERVLPFYVNPAEATEADKAYDMAIDHVTDAIRKRGEA